MIRTTFLALTLIAAPVLASADAALTRLYDILEFDSYIEITRAEGLSDVEDVAQNMLGRPADGGFLSQMQRLYDTERMRATVLAHLERTLTEREIEASLIFFGSDVGQRITELEVAARRAISEESIENGAREAWDTAEEDTPELAAHVHALMDVSDLVERNVAGALNSNLQFFRGLVEGGGAELTQEEMLIEVWSQEEEIRADTESWLGGYLMLAYAPLSDEDLTDYHAFWNTDVGRALNAAIFDGYNKVHDDISYATGRIIALNMGTEEL